MPVETPVYLIENTVNRGVEVKAYLGWDYLHLGTNPGNRVIFHRHGDGYTIQQTFSDWAGYNYWRRGDSGVFLGKRGDASTFHVVPTDRGLMLKGPDGCYVEYASSGDVTRWLQCYPEGDMFHAWAYFRTQE